MKAKFDEKRGGDGGAEKRREANIPRLLSLRILDHTLCMRTCGAAVGVLVVLIEGVGTPKDAVAVGTGVALVALVELVLVPLPVELALKGDVAKGAPVGAGGFGRSSVAAFHGRRGRHRERRCSHLVLGVSCAPLGRDGAHRGRRGQEARPPRRV